MKNHKKTIFLLIFLAVFGLSFFIFPQSVLAATISAAKWQVVEIPLISQGVYSTSFNPYTAMVVTATFTGPGNVIKEVKGFWDGDNNYKVRFTPTETGNWSYSISSTPGDSGLRQSGTITVGNAPMGAKGFVRVDDQFPEHFVYDNGDRYLMFGTTAYDLVMMTNADTNKNTSSSKLNRSIAYFKGHGINKVRFSVYTSYFPAYIWNPSYMGELKYPDIQPYGDSSDHIDPDPNMLNPNFFTELDEVVKTMNTNGIIADLIIFPDQKRGFGTDEQDERFSRYVIARYAAYPNVIWCLANEYQYVDISLQGIKNTLNYWNRIGNIFYTDDPYKINDGKRRPLSIHEGNPSGTNIGIFDFYDQAWPSQAELQFTIEMGTRNYNDTALLTNYMNKPKYDNMFSYSISCGENSSSTCTEADDAGYKSITHNQEIGKLETPSRRMPVVNDEYRYVNDKDFGISRNDHRRLIWGTYLAGGYVSMGDSYNEDGSLGDIDDCTAKRKIDSSYKCYGVDGAYHFRNWDTGLFWDNGEMKAAYDDVKYLTDFFAAKGIKYWEMFPQNNLIVGNVANNSKGIQIDNAKRVYVSANQDLTELVVYAADWQSGNNFNFTVNLRSDIKYSLLKYNPREGTGDAPIGAISGAYKITKPSQDWVYYIKAELINNPADVNSDGAVNIQDVQLCVNVILGTETDPAIVARAKAVVAPSDICDVLDLQMIVNEILK